MSVIFRVSSAIFGLLFTGCVRPWPDLPARTYSGVVFNDALHQPEPNATIVAIRPKMRGFAIIPWQQIGIAKSDANGRFTLRTTTGFATRMRASSSDGRLYVNQSVGRAQKENISIRIIPNLGVARYGTISPSANADEAQKAITNIISYISAHPRQPLVSLRAYAAMRVISQPQFDIFAQHPDVYFGSAPRVCFIWGNGSLDIRDESSPIQVQVWRVR